MLLSAVGPVAHTSTPLFTLWILGDGSATSVTESTSVSVNCVTIGAIFCFLNFVFKTIRKGRFSVKFCLIVTPGDFSSTR